MEVLEQGWVWGVAGALLLVGEAIIPGVLLVWFGVAALGAGLALAGASSGVVPPLSGLQAVVLFAVLSAVLVAVGRRLAARHSDTLLNRGGHRLIGRVVVVVDAIVAGSGRAQVGDGVWAVRGPDAPAGARMVVRGVDGTVLVVEPAGSGPVIL